MSSYGWVGKKAKQAYKSTKKMEANVRANPEEVATAAALGYLTGGAYNMATTGSAGTSVGVVGGGAGQVSGLATAGAAAVGAAYVLGPPKLPSEESPGDAPTMDDAGADDEQGDPALIAREQAKRRAALLANGRRSTFLTGPGGTLGQGQSVAMSQLLGG